MSEPLSTPEIEDVVSSVRRLVSTTQTPRVKTRDLSHDKLILTLSLRVVPDVEPAPEPKPEPEPALVAEAQITEPATAEGLVDESVPEAPFIEVETAESGPGATLHLVDAEWEDELWTEHETPLAEIAAEIEDAELVAAVEAELVADAWPEMGVMPESWSQIEPEWVEEAPIPFVPLHHRAAASPQAEVEAAGAPVEVPVAEMPSVEVPGVEMPMVEAPVVETPRVDSPDAATVRDVSEPVIAPGADAAVASAEPAAEHEPTLFDEDGNPIAILDEEALSEIVRNLIREELQGALGERITRNVRKLVRAEINRALAARAFD